MEMIVPLVIGLTLVWLVGRGTPWNAKLMTVAVTLGLIVLVVLLEKSGYWPDAWRGR